MDCCYQEDQSFGGLSSILFGGIVQHGEGSLDHDASGIDFALGVCLKVWTARETSDALHDLLSVVLYPLGIEVDTGKLGLNFLVPLL